MAKMRLTIGGRGPGGPLSGQKFPVSNDYMSRRERGLPRQSNADKKQYAGAGAGIGRPFGGTGRTPTGPAGAVFPTRLPNRSTTRAGKPGLMTRIVQRARRSLGF